MLGALGLGTWTTASPPIWPRCASTGSAPPRSSGRALRWIVGAGARGRARRSRAWRVGAPQVEARLFKTEVSRHRGRARLAGAGAGAAHVDRVRRAAGAGRRVVQARRPGRQGERQGGRAWSRTGRSSSSSTPATSASRSPAPRRASRRPGRGRRRRGPSSPRSCCSATARGASPTRAPSPRRRPTISPRARSRSRSRCTRPTPTSRRRRPR